MPSAGEGFGLVFLEAMAAGRPVVAWMTKDVRAAVTNEETGLLVAGQDATKMSDAILRLLNERGVARAMGERGRRRAEESFSLTAVASGLERVYSELVRAKGA